MVYGCILCQQSFDTLKDLKKHIHAKHRMHENSVLVIDYLRMMDIKEDVPAPKLVVEPVVETVKVSTKKSTTKKTKKKKVSKK